MRGVRIFVVLVCATGLMSASAFGASRSVQRTPTAVKDDATFNVAVPGTADIFGAGLAQPPALAPSTGPAGTGGGTLPPSVSFVASAGEVLTVPSSTGEIYFKGPTLTATPNGNPDFMTSLNPVGPISGLIDTNSCEFLTGVFLGGAAPTGAPPASLNFSNSAIGDNYTTLSPQLGQTFLIGTGRTSSGALHEILVPAGAARFFLGVPDGPYCTGDPGTYNDNGGAYHATVALGAPPVCGEPIGIPDKPDYCIPPDWNTKRVRGDTPGVEPLNVIISGRSTVPRAKILGALSKYFNWDAIRPGKLVPAGCSSIERADLFGTKFVSQNMASQPGGCLEGNPLTLTGRANHARVWFQRRTGAWFIAAAYETACYKTHKGTLNPVEGSGRTLAPSGVRACTDGGLGSFGKNGYNRGAKNLAVDLRTAARKSGWTATVRTDTRPSGVGEDIVSFGTKVYVVTVDQKASRKPHHAA